MKLLANNIVGVLLCLILIHCKKEYAPKVIETNYNFLVVDGFINTAPGGVSIISLSRSRMLDSTISIPEIGANLTIHGENGDNYSLNSHVDAGTYSSDPLNLSSTSKYQLLIETADGHSYSSDYAFPKSAPLIDSVYWVLGTDPLTASSQLDIRLSTHDPSNNSRYYRWSYVETWQTNAHYETFWGLSGDTIFPVTEDNNNYSCWTSAPSYRIILGSSAALTADVISDLQIAHFSKDDPKLDTRYSILVSQYVLDSTAYNYWQTVQKNSQNVGTLFDLQPSQIIGNIHAVSNNSEVVIGYVSAGIVSQKRIFIENYQLPSWQSMPFTSCTLLSIAADPLDYKPFTYSDTSYAPYYFSAMGSILHITKKDCLDCRRLGGSTIKPSFW